MTQDPTLVIAHGEALRLLGPAPAPLLARRLRGRAGAVYLTHCPGGGELVLDWLDSPLARGWIASHPAAGELAPRVEAALGQGFVAPDAVILARTQLAGGMPVMGFDDEDAPPDAATLARWQRVLHERGQQPAEPLGLYAICASAQDVGRRAAQGIAEIQLRVKSPAGDIGIEIAAALRAVAGTGSRLWVNDHWQAALDAGVQALHLGQEDWAHLLPAQRQALLADGIALSLSSHSLWELARARGLAPACIACGPIHPTTTKAMPWRPQGLHNLAWWVAHAGRPVLAIGGLLTPAQVRGCAAAGAAAACLVRALDGPVPLAEFEQAWQDGRRGRRQPPPAPLMGPRPSLTPS